MYNILTGLRVIECSSFVAAPSAGLYLSQLGAEIIRIDQIGGGPDFRRWPVSKNNDSFYWEGLNKGKKSVALDITSPKGRELMVALATASGENCGILLTNYPEKGFLSHTALAKHRADQITVRVMGRADGGSALDYTVNSAVGLPYMTGPEALGDQPVNHVLPAWDLLTGAYAAFAIMSAVYHRQQSGAGQEIRLPLSDFAMSSLAHLGMVAETLQSGQSRPRYGNDVYGAYGRDFVTADGKRLIIMALTARQWRALVEVLDMAAEITALETRLGADLSESEGVRFAHREAIHALVAPKVARMEFAPLTQALDKAGGCWGLFQTLHEAVQSPDLVTENPIFETMKNVSGMHYPIPGAAATIPQQTRNKPRAAPALGADSEEIMLDMLGLSAQQFSKLVDEGIVGIG
ncbi:MAG: CoA transferase [Parvibaculales bacterium]